MKLIKRMLMLLFVGLIIVGMLFAGKKIDSAAKSTTLCFREQTPFAVTSGGVIIMNKEIKIKDAD